MPVHRVTTAEGPHEAAVAEIEKKERVTAVVPQGDGSVLIYTEPKRQKPGPRETR